MGRALAAAILLLAAPADATEHPPGSLEQTQLIVARFQERFATVRPAMGDRIEDLYSADVEFRDPVTRLTGREAMQRYLRHFGETAEGARFAITDTVVQPGNAVVFWTMTMADGETSIDGVSHLLVTDRVYRERDFFDLGEVYERIPVLGWLTGLVKGRLAPPVEAAAGHAE